MMSQPEYDVTSRHSTIQEFALLEFDTRQGGGGAIIRDKSKKLTTAPTAIALSPCPPNKNADLRENEADLRANEEDLDIIQGRISYVTF